MVIPIALVLGAAAVAGGIGGAKFGLPGSGGGDDGEPLPGEGDTGFDDPLTSLEEELAALDAQFPGGFGADDLGPTISFDTSELSTDVELIDATLRAMVETEYLNAETLPDFYQTANALTNARDLQAGRLTLDSGELVYLEDFADADPFVQEQIRNEFSNRKIDVENQAIELRNAFRIQSASDARAAVAARNSALSQDFVNRNREFESKLALGELDLARAATELERSLGGLNESRSRAKFEADVLQDSTPFGTIGGKTEFSSADLGAGVGALAQQAGISDPNASVIGFPGSISLNPNQMLADQDAKLGVSGQLPGVPDLPLSQSDVPGAPSLSFGGGGGATGLEQFITPNTIQPPTAAELMAMAEQARQENLRDRVQASGAPLSQLPR